MKVAILTITNGENYGNRLQNYAVQQVIKSFDMEVETIPNFTNQELPKKTIFKEYVKRYLTNIYVNTNFFNIEKLNNVLRNLKFKNFTNKYINQSNFYISSKKIPTDISSRYDYFVCGSDQIWNPEFYFNSNIDFLTFANKEQRVAFAPSFGISELPKESKEDYKQWLNGFKYLSVREKAGANIIKELTGKDAEVLLDPTLMLSRDEWISIAKKPKLKENINKKFILTYFLGEKSNKMKEKIKNIAINNDLEIINLLDISDKFKYSIDPSEFLWLMNNCSLMCTDSFHGSVFSLIMKKPFIVFERIGKETSMNSRLENLLNLFNMMDRKSEDIKEKDIFNIDFSKVDLIISNEKKKTISYLKKALNLK
ncbi:polysaccharide pyruvyl transferase family protein [Clostridium perfringens]|uniref:polysaccharide pyruvyl transferase family protein n=1 Tax=Clostridium perfringens TaxID=1502 RepID=UPI000D89767F|nr:polysaccharide pyruvyl transferase family protein [Clostridium perfringens]MDM0859162.1 polysaccharide pyruvyl transferase family protein [Clostridium perfringens]SQB38915.1 Polysaccharide pyruvyl transferase [Clostridium perfringens]